MAKITHLPLHTDVERQPIQERPGETCKIQHLACSQQPVSQKHGRRIRIPIAPLNLSAEQMELMKQRIKQVCRDYGGEW